MGRSLGNLRIWLAAALVALAGASATGWQIVESRAARLEAAAELARSLSAAAAQRIAGSLRGLDLFLQEMAEQAPDPAHPPEGVLHSLKVRAASIPEIDSFAYADAQGRIRLGLAANREMAREPALDVSAGPPFVFQRDNWARRSVFLMPPAPDIFSGHPVMVMSRPIIGRDGGFAGVAALAAKQDFIEQALASVVPRDGDAAGLFTLDGTLYGRAPADPRFVGKSIANGSIFKAFQEAGPDGIASRAVSFSDGAERILAFAMVPNYPLVASVGVSRDRVLEPGRQELWVHGTVQSLFTAMVFLLAWGLARSEQRRETVTDRLLAAERNQVESLAQAVAERTTELKDSLRALSESEERFRRIVDITPQPLVLTRRADGRVLYINAGAAEIFGVPQEKAEGEVAPDYWDDPADRGRLVEGLRRDGMVRNMEAVLKRANGERFIALLSASTMDLLGEDVNLVSVLDITERKRLEEELGRSNRDLEQFSYAVSHDLQEPLRMVSSYLALLERRAGATLSDESKEFIFYAVDGAKRMSRMITDLLEFSRVHRRGAMFAPVDLDVALREALSNLGPAMQAAEARVEAAPLPTVMGDSSQLMRVFQNLVGNALKYRKPDVAPEVHITARRDGGEWVISVTDNGIGIDPAHADRLFQVFQRLNPRGAYEGSGVGLALCRRILERHQGRIWMESAGEGQGCTFNFTLPAEHHP